MLPAAHRLAGAGCCCDCSGPVDIQEIAKSKLLEVFLNDKRFSAIHQITSQDIAFTATGPKLAAAHQMDATSAVKVAAFG